MQNFTSREDRFHFFNNFENPLLNLTFPLEVPNFLPYCKEQKLPPFHFFLYHLFVALHEMDNFRYRIYQGKVIAIDKIIASFTVLNQDNIFNYTRFEYTPDLKEFIKRSLVAKEEAMQTPKLIHTGEELSEREMKNYVFITSLPWLNFTSIQHPVFKAKSADIPAVSWGKFKAEGHTLTMPFSVQAHHGFVDGFHIYSLGEKIKEKLSQNIL